MTAIEQPRRNAELETSTGSAPVLRKPPVYLKGGDECVREVEKLARYAIGAARALNIGEQVEPST